MQIALDLSLRGYGAGAAAPWTPAELAPALWLEADAIVGLNDGDPVSSWADSSGNDRTPTQSEVANKPTYKTNIQNGMPIVRFDGGDYLITPSTRIVGVNGHYTMFAVAKSSAGGYPQVIMSQDNGSTTRVFQFRYGSSSSLEMIAFATGGSPFADSMSSGISGFDVLEGVRDATTVEALVNGSSNGSTGTTGTPDASSLQLFIGIFNGSVAQLNGDIGEILVFDSALSAGQRTQVRDYLASRWGT